MKILKSLLSLPLIAFAIAPAMAADGDFSLQYHVERTLSTDLDLDQCIDAVKSGASDAGYRMSTDRYEGKLGVISGGPKQGGSLIAYCIVVDDKTVSVIQGLDYDAGSRSVSNVADRIHDALLAKGKK